MGCSGHGILQKSPSIVFPKSPETAASRPLRLSAMAFRLSAGGAPAPSEAGAYVERKLDMRLSTNGDPQNGWFICKNPIKMDDYDDLGVHLFWETSTWSIAPIRFLTNPHPYTSSHTILT